MGESEEGEEQNPLMLAVQLKPSDLEAVESGECAREVLGSWKPVSLELVMK